MLNFIGKLLFGLKLERPESEKFMIPSMCEKLRNVWEGDYFLLTRLINLFLALIQFVNPYNYFCALVECIFNLLFGKEVAYKALYFASELYIIGKLTFSLLVLFTGLNSVI